MKKYAWLITSILILTLALTGCSLWPSPVRSAPAPVPTATVAPPLATGSSASTTPGSSASDLLAALQGTLENVYLQVNPSVVNIAVVQKAQITTPVIPEIPGFPFFGPFSQTPQGPQEFYQRGLGSGFVWDTQGHIVTNNHVVADADEIAVTFHDGTTVSATVVGTDPDSDLAVVKVDAAEEDLQPVRLADSTQVKVGQLAIAIGNPFGLEGTMTQGIVSAVGRLLPTNAGSSQGPGYSIPDVIQTDAPINPGNSGGVLVDDNGEVIGVTAAIESPVGANAGVGFAIPAAIVQKVVPTLIATGRFEHPWLGISGTSLQPDLAQAMGLKADQRGALVVDVVPGGPADKAGLHGSDRTADIQGQQVTVGGDIIVGIDGQPVTSFDDLVTHLARSTEVGQAITLTVLRDGKQQTIEVTLAARPAAKNQSQLPNDSRRLPAKAAWLGIRGITVTPEVAQAMDLSADQQGVLVERVEIGSPADEAGLHGSFKAVTIQGQRTLVGGDVIVAVDGQPVSQIDDLTAFLKQAQPGQDVTLTVLRDGKQLDLAVTLAEQPTTISDSNWRPGRRRSRPSLWFSGLLCES